MLKSLFLAAAVTASLIFAMGARADDAQPAATLHVGDAAPPLVSGKWLKGTPVQSFDKDKLYVVEFWATWCGPCKASIPHLTELQKQYKDITFIGQDVWEQDQTAVPAFVDQMGDKMDYRVAMDDMKDSDKGKMAQTWMDAAGQNSIPTAFVIGKDQKIAWIGHPMELTHILPAVVAGTFDAKKEAEASAAREAIGQKLEGALQANDYDKALALVDELAKADPGSADRLQILKYRLLLQKKDVAGAVALAGPLTETFKDDADALNEIAWGMVDPENPLDKPDLAFAEKTALRANEVTKGASAEILDTLARIYFIQGKIDQAIDFQTKAIDKASDDQKEPLRKTLDEYKAKKDAAK